MKQLILSAAVICIALFGACQKEKTTTTNSNTACPDNPRAAVDAAMQGNWMYGQFSMTEYWSQNPADYLGNAVQFAFAFKFNADGTYEQYFTSSTVSTGIRTYQQSLTKGTVVINKQNKTISTYACSSRYKKTSNGQTIEERDLATSEITLLTNYTFTTGVEANGKKAVYLKLEGTSNPLTFLQKF